MFTPQDVVQHGDYSGAIIATLERLDRIAVALEKIAYRLDAGLEVATLEA